MSPRPEIRKVARCRGFFRTSAANRGAYGSELTPVFRQYMQIPPQYTETYTMPIFAESMGLII